MSNGVDDNTSLSHKGVVRIITSKVDKVLRCHGNGGHVKLQSEASEWEEVSSPSVDGKGAERLWRVSFTYFTYP